MFGLFYSVPIQMHAAPSMLMILPYVKLASMPPKNSLRDCKRYIPHKNAMYYIINVHTKLAQTITYTIQLISVSILIN